MTEVPKTELKPKTYTYCTVVATSLSKNILEADSELLEGSPRMS